MRKTIGSENSNSISDDDFEYSERSDYWSAQPPQKRHHLQKHRYREPLILCGYGVDIRVDHDTLLVRDGFTHYPQKAGKLRFFPGDGNLPDRVIIMDGSGGITLDALAWMTEQSIELVQLDWKGHITNVGGNSGYSGNSKLIAAQREIRSDKRRLKIAQWLISEKITASRNTLEKIFPNSELREKAISQLDIQARKLENSLASLTMPKLFGIEGAAAKAYFQIWPGLPIKWKNLGKRPIPQNWAETIPRTMGWRKRSRQARHPVNAMLNYGYGFLASQLRSQIVAAGLDPTIGLIHERKDNPIPLVYDLMEPLRPLVDREVLQFALTNTFMSGDFTINKWGGCRLNPQMAKTVASLAKSVSSTVPVSRFLKVLYYPKGAGSLSRPVAGN